MKQELTVIYNANCPICSREIAGYRRYSQTRGLPIRFKDLGTADLTRLGLTPQDAARRLHVIRNGALLAGVEAFAALWQAMPRFRWLGKTVMLRPVRPMAEAVYERILAPILYAMHTRRVRRQR